jgi:ABC-2 type transport system permease protein/lipopolysaccharide transport system permease protein
MIVQFAFFFTPVIWQIQQLPGRSILVELNPFYYLMEVVRAPLLGSMPSLQLWAGTIVIVIASWAMAFVFFMRYRQRVSYWV